MLLEGSVKSFTHDYSPGAVHFGNGCVGDLESTLDRHGLQRALIITGRTIGTNSDVIDPVKNGVGSRFAGVFPQTTPQKYIGTAFDAVKTMKETKADSIIALGGGSSIDIAKCTSILMSCERSVEELKDEIREFRTLTGDEDRIIPLFTVPTTLAGADHSKSGGIRFTKEPTSSPGDEITSGKIVEPAIMPRGVFYDSDLFATTPDDILASSAMNGFDKAIELLYSRPSNPVTDATATHSLRYLSSGLLNLRGAEATDEALSQSIVGVMLAQYGLDQRDVKPLALIHAFGHGFSRPYDVQQGDVHGICAPHVLKYLFDHVHARRDLIADGLGVDSDDPTEIIREVTRIRDALNLPSNLRAIPGVKEEHLPAIAKDIMNNLYLVNIPEELDPTAKELESVLRSAW